MDNASRESTHFVTSTSACTTTTTYLANTLTCVLINSTVYCTTTGICSPLFSLHLLSCEHLLIFLVLWMHTSSISKTQIKYLQDA